MQKTFLIVALFVGLLLISAAYNGGRAATAVGDRAPALSFDSPPSEALKALRGKYVLLNFWSATNGPSRQAVGRYTAWVNNNPGEGVGLLSINLDRSEALFHEIVKRDGLNQQLQFNISDSRAERILRDYNLDDGCYGTVLIAPDGRVLAHNPTPGQLHRLVHHSPRHPSPHAFHAA